MAGKTLVTVAMNEAYWNAARVVCEICADKQRLSNIPLMKINGTWAHKYIITIECNAAPIHALIEELNEVNK